MHPELAKLLEKQCGLVTWSQMRDLGLSKHRIATLVRRGQLHRVRPATYALAGVAMSWERMLRAAILAAGDGAVASHGSAARLWAYACLPDGGLEVLVPGELRNRIPGVRLHRSTRIDADDVVRSGIPRTTFERTLCDCSTSLSSRQLGRVLDDGLRRGVASLKRLASCAERLESGPGRHMSVIRALLGVRGLTFDPGGSDSELALLPIFERGGIPQPTQQFPVRVGAKTYSLDFSWPELKVFAEHYGLPFHTGASAVAHDNERLTALVARGWLPLIFTDDTSEQVIIDRTAAVLAQRQDWGLSPRKAG